MAQTTMSAAALLILLIPLLSHEGGLAAAGDRATPSPVPIGMPNCVTSCGGVDVPYPFGIGTDARCYLPGFNLTCDNTTGRLLLAVDGSLQVLQIGDVSGAILKAQHDGAVKIDGNGDGTLSSGLRRDGPYTLWNSELILTGCNVQATVKRGDVTVASCTSLCHDAAAPPAPHDDDETDRCSGGSTGCCRANLVSPGGYDGSSRMGTSSAYDVQLRSLGGRNRSADLPVLVFVAEQGWFNNRSVYTEPLHRAPSKETVAVPLWLTWEVVGQGMAQSSNVCKSKNSQRTNGTRGAYTCACKESYQGNPYLADGCKDSNECESGVELTGCYGECINTEGSYTCRCPAGTNGNFSIRGGCVTITITPTGSCMRWCGNVQVPYPFGIGPSRCYMPGLGLACDTTHDPPQLLLGSNQFRIVNISLLNNTMRVIAKADLMSNASVTSNGIPQLLGQFPSFFDQEAPYSLSTSNELILIGCNAQVTVFGHSNPAIISGCASYCSNNDIASASSTRSGVVGWPTNDIHGGSSGGGKYCYLRGCCQARISESMDGMPKELRFQWFDTTSKHHELMRLPGHVFIAEEGWFDRPSVVGKLMPEGQDRTSAENMEVPLLLRWELLLMRNGSSLANMRLSHPDCGRDQLARDLCRSKQSHCKPGNRGYSCQCNIGYSGNPYIEDGCKGGRAKSIKGFSIIIGVASGASPIVLVLIAYIISYKFKHGKAQMLKRKYFEQNRGQLLQQLLSHRTDIAEKMIVSLEELEKATNNFDKSCELGGGGHGTVYKGILSDLHVVAIKKPKMLVRREIDEFINEVAILSQINHRNVVKLYGCCLETEVPMLVYEFVSNGTLYDHLHVKGPTSLSWGDRLRIAIETAKSTIAT